MNNFVITDEKLTLKAIKDLENEHKVKFTKLYTNFLLENNGGCLEKAIFKISDSQGESAVNEFFSINNTDESLFEYIDIFEGRMPSDFIPIGIDPNGNIICLGIKNEYYESTEPSVLALNNMN